MLSSTFTKYVEIGRIAYIAFGKDVGKIVAIVDVIDQNKVLVDGPCSGVPRMVINLKLLQLTKFKIQFPHSARSGTVRKAWEKEDISKKWAESTWAKKLAAKKLRTTLSDFDRFKLMKAKQARNRLIKIELGKLKKVAKKNPAVKTRKPNKKVHPKKVY